jgi:Malic enzyme
MTIDKDETTKLYELSIYYSKIYRGKISIIPKVPIRNLNDFSIWYTPGVAGVSLEIAKNKEKSFDLTGRWNTIAIVTDGTRVLGLGNIGPEASMPVMEGKALIFKYLGGVDAIPLPIKVDTVDQFVNVVKAVEPSFGGINLEDIESPKCFYLLDTIRKELNIPVWHDDQQGTAGATLAGALNAIKLVGKSLKDIKIVFYGAGASNIATANLFINAGFDAGKMILIDSKGILHPEREDMDKLMLNNPWKYELSIKTNKYRIKGGLKEALEDADMLVAASKPGPNAFKKEYIKVMNNDSIVFLLANPIPEIWPWEAKEMGAKIVATGRSDFPNQINNSLIFPSVFRGALDAKSKKISDEMIIAASKELAKYAEEKGINENYIIPSMDEWQVYPRVAAAVASKAVEQGLAREIMSWNEYYEIAKKIIQESRVSLNTLIEKGVIRNLLNYNSV